MNILLKLAVTTALSLIPLSSFGQPANPYELPGDRLLDLKVEKLILGGKDYKPQHQSIPLAVIKGMLSRKKA